MKTVLKKFLCLLLVASFVLSIVSCRKIATITTEDTEDKGTDAAVTKETKEAETMSDTKESQKTTQETSDDCKKVIFVGNSFIYYGETVLEKTVDKLDLTERVHDEGYFYQLCKANGVQVDVTNWTFGGHDITNIITDKNCTISTVRACYGKNHVQHLTDKKYDVVVVSPGSGMTPGKFIDELTAAKALFTEANPNVKLVCLCAAALHGLSDKKYLNADVLNNLKTAESMGYVIADWGGFVADIVNGAIKIPNSKFTYDQNSFIIRKSDSDGTHPNQLAGYITTLMAYCAITGEKAEGQPYNFCTDSKINSKFSVEKFKSKNYVNGATTNYDQIFKDKNEMLNIQKLIDKYLADKPYRNFNYAE